MHETASTFHIDLLIVLLLVASGVAIAVKWVRLPYSIALVIVGLFIGVCHVLPPIDMTPELILLVFLPALLFEASWNIRLKSLKENWVPITVLAVIGVLMSMAIVGAIMFHWGVMAIGSAYLFGALISATDPISVLALFRKIGIDHRLTMILEGESLFNDGTAAVLFNIILAAVMAQAAFNPLMSFAQFIMVVAGGIIVGFFTGFAASRVTSFFDDHLLEITLTTILAYGTFLIAENLKVSPVIAVVVAGIIMGNYGSRAGMSPTTRLAVNSFWEYAAFIVNSLVFLLIGMQVKFDLLAKYAETIGVAILAILGARLIIFIFCPIMSSKDRPIPLKWQTLLYWGSLRGSLCMALALSLPFQFPDREEFIITTFGVVLFTLIIQGLTIEPLVRVFKMRTEDERLKEYERLKTSLIAESEALNSLNAMIGSSHISRTTYEEIKKELSEELHTLQDRLENLHVEDASVKRLEFERTRLHLLEVKKDCVTRLVREGIISEDAANALRTDIDSKVYEVMNQNTAELETNDVPPVAREKPDAATAGN